MCIACIYLWVDAHTRNQACNQDQITKAYQTKIQSTIVLSQLLNTTKLMDKVQFIKMSKCLLVLQIHCAEFSFVWCKWMGYLDRKREREIEGRISYGQKTKLYCVLVLYGLKIGLKWISAVTVQCQSTTHSTINLCRKYHGMVSSSSSSSINIHTVNMCIVMLWDHIIF